MRNVLPPLISLVIVMLGNGFFNTFASLRISIDGYASWVVGILNASYYAGVMMGSIYVARLIDRIGHIRTFAIFASVNSLIIVVQSMLIGPISWTFCRFLSGFCAPGFFIVVESWLLLSSGVKTRGRALSLYMLFFYLAQGFGQFMLNISPLISLLPFAITIALSSLSVIPVCMIKSSGPLMLESSLTNLFQIVRKAPLGPVGCFLSGMIMGSLYGLVPIFGKEINLSVFQISQVMGFAILGGVVLQWPIGHLSDIFNRRKVLIGVSIALMILTLFLFYVPHFPYYVLLASMVLFGGISFAIYPLSIGYTCDYFSEKNMVGITCSLLIIYSTGSVIGPLIAPVFMILFGASGIFLYISLLCVSYTVVAMLRLVHSKLLYEDEQSDYLPLPSATSLAFYLDPRSEQVDDDDLVEYGDDQYPFCEEYEDED